MGCNYVFVYELRRMVQQEGLQSATETAVKLFFWNTFFYIFAFLFLGFYYKVKKKMSAIIEVKWNGKKFPVEFQSVKELETTTVKHLKAYIQRMTGINANSIRLQAFGGK